jgi:hypothetical protein
MFLRSASRSKFEAIVGSDMRTLFAILGLLFCLIAARAADPARDQGLGSHSLRWQKCRGARLGRLRHDQPTGNRFYQFRTRIPNQTFAVFIASAQERLRLVARKTISLLMAALSLILTASHSHAGSWLDSRAI